MRWAVTGIVGACALAGVLRLACAVEEHPQTLEPRAAEQAVQGRAPGQSRLTLGASAPPSRIASPASAEDGGANGNKPAANPPVEYAVEVQVLDSDGRPIPLPLIASDPWGDVPALTARRGDADGDSVEWERGDSPTTWRFQAEQGLSYVLSSWDGVGFIANAKIQVTPEQPLQRVSLQLGPAESSGRLLLTPTVTGVGGMAGSFEFRIAAKGGLFLVAGQLAPNEVFSRELPSGEYRCVLIDSAYASVPSTAVEFSVTIVGEEWERLSIAMPPRGQLRVELINPDWFGVDLRVVRAGEAKEKREPLFGTTASLEPGDWELLVDGRAPIPFQVRANETVTVTVQP